ncbi:MAG: ArsC family reductase [Gammaproteobacteria bacterium]|nr:ArsC family reductase [Gammaproteobacteria bacterium]
MNDSVTIYGIANCDTIKKAKNWLDKEGVEYVFHDYRKQGLNIDQLEAWVGELGWESLLNKRGTTWRKLPDEVKGNVDRASAIKIMLENPSIIKRPLLDKNNQLATGFSDSLYRELFAS